MRILAFSGGARAARLLSVMAFMAITAEAASATSPGEGREVIARFDRTFARLDTLVFGPYGARWADRSVLGETTGKAGSKLSADGALSAFGGREATTISSQLDEALTANTAAKVREGDGKTGLQLTGQSYLRLKGNGGYEDETGEGHYRAKFQAELRWYLLQCSLFGREGRRRAAQIEEEIARAGYEKERTDISDFRLKAFITEHYDSLTAGVLQHRLDVLRQLDAAQHYLLGSEQISSDEIVRTLNERMAAERKLSAIEKQYPAATSLAGVAVTTVAIDSAALVRHVADSQGDMRILQLRMELLQQREKNEKWWADLNLAPFLRYAHYFRRVLPDSYNIDAGVTFTIPISDAAGARRRTLRSERAVLEAETERLSRRVADKTALVVAECGRLDRASVSEVRRIAELRGYLQQRTEAYRRSGGEHNRLARAREYTMYLEALERLIEYQYRRDCLVAELQALLPDETVMRFCRFVPLREQT